MTAMLWVTLIALPSLVCAIPNAQLSFHNPADNLMVAHDTTATFMFKDGSGVFTPKDLVELSRPGPGVANVPGDLVLVPVSKYSFENKKCVHVSSYHTSFSHPDACVQNRRSVRAPRTDRDSRTTFIVAHRTRGDVSETRSFPVLSDFSLS